MKCERCGKRGNKCRCPKFGGEEAKDMYQYFESKGRVPGEGFQDLLEFSGVIGIKVTYERDLSDEVARCDHAAYRNEAEAARLRSQAEEYDSVAAADRSLQYHASKVLKAFS